MDSILHVVTEYLVDIIEACGAIIIVFGAARAMWGYLKGFFGKAHLRRMASLRLQLGQNLVMALEFQVAADILRTALSPTWNDLLVLGALIALRTILNYILEVELRNLVTDVTAQARNGVERDCAGEVERGEPPRPTD
jgi:uncharacterized membrane protein